MKGRTRGNTPFPDGWIDEVKAEVCGWRGGVGKCPIYERCRDGDRGVGERFMWPFCSNQDPEIAALTATWKERVDRYGTRNLEDDVAARKAGQAPFDRGTFINL